MTPDDRGAIRHAGTAEDWWEGTTARVFVSCGQRTKAERKFGTEVKKFLRAEGYCPYVAVGAHSSRSLREEIFDRLQTAEYVLFVDFRRERVGRTVTRRGSLFSHQELAVASFLDTDVLPFQQRGVKREGVLDYIQGNPVPFDSPADLLEKVKSEIRDAGWRSDWRRDLTVELVKEGPDDATWPDGRRARYFHIWVRNQHRRLVASECTVFLTRVIELATGTVRVPDSVQLKPRRSVDLFVAIPPGHAAQFDVAFIFFDAPSNALAGINPFKIDSTTAARQALLEGPGEFELTYEIYSREFPPIRATGRLLLGSTVDQANFRLLEHSRRVDPTDDRARSSKVSDPS
jgi:hypothetical protein